MSNDALLWAVKNGDIEAVKEAAKKADFNVNAELMNGRNPIHYAADYGHLDIIEFFVSKGANVNAMDKHGITPLLAAIFEDHADCVKLLLLKGAKKDGKAPSGCSYLDSAESDEVKVLLK